MRTLTCLTTFMLLGLAAAHGRRAAAVAGLAMSPASATGGAPPAGVMAGIDVVVAEHGGPLRGLRIGLITNQTGRTRTGRSTIDALFHLPGVTLVSLFSPEHGIRGTARPGEKVARGRDADTGLPIYSLYGATLAPTDSMLQGLDALVFDIQDVGARYYTFDWTMALALQAAARRHLRFIVLDRPDPIGGTQVQGNVQDPQDTSFVGLYPVPMRTGLTPGELARWVNGEYHVGAELTVVPARGWRRSMWYDGTGLPWVAPSPNMPDLASATSYPGTCLFEGTNLSVGRGTPIAFQQIGAPWLDADSLARVLNARRLPGVRFVATHFTPVNPGDDKFGGVALPGLRFVVTNRRAYDPTIAAVAALVELHRLQPDSLHFLVGHFDRLAGTPRLRLGILAGKDVATLTAGWAAQRARFIVSAKKYWLYPD
jgi:uncharacterized protein YbbC (DUF1343 family)